MNDREDISQQTVAIQANAAGLSLSLERPQALILAATRLQQTARWLSKKDLGLTEPAFVFDAQARDEFSDGE